MKEIYALPPDVENAFPDVANHIASIRKLLAIHDLPKPHELPKIAENIAAEIEAIIETTLSEIQATVIEKLKQFLLWLAGISIQVSEEQSVQHILREANQRLPEHHLELIRMISDCRRTIQVELERLYAPSDSKLKKTTLFISPVPTSTF